jgi:hypothetical protein
MYLYLVETIVSAAIAGNTAEAESLASSLDADPAVQSAAAE